jgi:translation initiation factor 1A
LVLVTGFFVFAANNFYIDDSINVLGLMEEQQIRVRTPRGKEILGTIEEFLGASRFNVLCTDGKKRLCRIPGKFRRRIKVRVGDVVLVTPWDIEPETKGDVEWIYTPTQAHWLRTRGFIK